MNSLNHKLAFIIAFLLVQFSFAQTNDFEVHDYKQLVKVWNKAHNSWQFNDLRRLYAPKVLFYCTWMNKDQCILDKTSQMRPSIAFHQTISSSIHVKTLGENLTVCSFIKSVRIENTLKDYPAYLVITEIDGQLRIIAESDEITDRNRDFVLSESVFKANDQASVSPTNQGIKTRSNVILYTATSAALIVIIAFAARRRRKIKQQIITEETTEEIKTPTPSEEISSELEFTNKEKGDLFETFVINKFDTNYFTLLDRTNDTVTNGVHALSRSNPDLLYQFELRGYIKKFAVECTYCSTLSELISIKLVDQLARYKTYGEEKKVNVYILFGLGGTPQNPKELFIIPLEKAKPKMTYNELKLFGRSTVNRLYLDRDSGLLT